MNQHQSTDSHDSFLSTIAPDMEGVNRIIREQLHSNVPFISQIAEYLINAGGKRIRPALVLLMARAFGYQGTQHQMLAAMIEFIHTATLLHDDVVDEADLRRGKSSANALFGNAASVLVGDFLYTRAFQMIVAVNDMRILPVLSDATNLIAEGEVMQLVNVRNPAIDEKRYMEVIYAKTARLFEVSAVLGALIAHASEKEIEAAAAYGRSLGIAFQLVDDLLDYAGETDVLGKTVGNDLREGKMTLPLIFLMSHCDESIRKTIRECIENHDEASLPFILEAVKASDALDYTARKAQDAANDAAQALSCLRDSQYKETLIKLSTFSAERNY
ncbi:polyprenyl synthetase family protein [Oxalobacter formigenes]|uniref:Octaprenyl diphosphate synthase n=1 Tax=Oxalobacter formigenes OXCC13 TaxID=556269 RepID=C3XBY8_OXAFO|nr:polyprenyl synthetase family protein [Oxalobacter formigenes]ARQ45116.1 Octaprenyl-diphosphate synthase [Oxalobacter formigenes]EEO30714.1 octaprenyl pyrophosphate synthetase [Oxalobacter formigenes OXCC13]MCZ4063754.1 polyprenyl synthetase family protein [Oxalobacter formigenes]WAW08042.1 polyprenyl synthetase family protein [Oxalobacter formigenes]